MPQGASPHVPNDSIVLDGQAAAMRVSKGAQRGCCLALSGHHHLFLHTTSRFYGTAIKDDLCESETPEHQACHGCSLLGEAQAPEALEVTDDAKDTSFCL